MRIICSISIDPPQFKAISIMKEKPCKETLEKWHKDQIIGNLASFTITKKTNAYYLQRIAWAGWTVNFANTISVAVL
jgi:hypothetical protein